MEELQEAIGEFDIAHIFLLITTVCGSVASVCINLYRRLGKYSVALIPMAEEQFSGSEHSGEEKLNYVTDELHRKIPAPLRFLFPKRLIQRLIGDAFKNIDAYADVRENEKAKASEPPPQAEPQPQKAPPELLQHAPPPKLCGPPPSSRTAYTFVREKRGRVFYTQYSIKRWEYPLQSDAGKEK